MKIRSDSLYATLGRLDQLDEFFAYYIAENPSYQDMTAWLSERSISTSNGALHNLIAYQLQRWRIAKAIESADAEVLTLPADIDDQTRARIKALRLDLAMRDISVDQALALIRLDQDRDRTDIASRKLALLEAREASARNTLTDATLTPEQRDAKLKSLFGIK
jgi:hypothetical protein